MKFIFLLGALFGGPLALAADAPSTLETVLVTGQVPGPALWKVQKGDHVLWLMGTIDLLPEKIDWRSQEVESAIADSQEVLGISYGEINVNLFQDFGALFQMPHIKDLPDGKKLSDVLPADIDARWLALKQKYHVDDRGIERLRPRYAADAIFEQATRHIGLTDDPEIWDAVKKLARKHHVKVTTNDFRMAIASPRERMKKLMSAPIEPELPCLSATLDRLEVDIANVRTRANAWAVGDIDLLRKLPYVSQDQACWDALASSGDLSQTIREMNGRIDNDWMTAATRALERNASTFGMLPMTDLLAGTGRVALLRERGYTVTPPGDN